MQMVYDAGGESHTRGHMTSLVTIVMCATQKQRPSRMQCKRLNAADQKQSLEWWIKPISVAKANEKKRREMHQQYHTEN